MSNLIDLRMGSNTMLGYELISDRDVRTRELRPNRFQPHYSPATWAGGESMESARVGVRQTTINLTALTGFPRSHGGSGARSPQAFFLQLPKGAIFVGPEFRSPWCARLVFQSPMAGQGFQLLEGAFMTTRVSDVQAFHAAAREARHPVRLESYGLVNHEMDSDLRYAAHFPYPNGTIVDDRLVYVWLAARSYHPSVHGIQEEMGALFDEAMSPIPNEYPYRSYPTGPLREDPAKSRPKKLEKVKPEVPQRVTATIDGVRHLRVRKHQ